MIEFIPDAKELESALDFALLWATQFLQAKILDIAPRDLERLPENINRKDGKKPKRSTHFKPINIAGSWYSGISGKLKQSISHEQAGQLEYKIGIVLWTANEYAKFLEFGTRKMRPRSFLRKWLADNEEEAINVFKSLLANKM